MTGLTPNDYTVLQSCALRALGLTIGGFALVCLLIGWALS
jgi:hypothetical protein